jgi:hypothetical protein
MVSWFGWAAVILISKVLSKSQPVVSGHREEVSIPGGVSHPRAKVLLWRSAITLMMWVRKGLRCRATSTPDATVMST